MNNAAKIYFLFLAKSFMWMYETAKVLLILIYFYSGNFYALSYNTKIDEDNSIALLSSGKTYTCAIILTKLLYFIEMS